MSSKNIVNKDHYDIGGRDRPNETVLGEQQKQKYAQAQGQSPAPSGKPGAPNFIPGAAPVGESGRPATSATDADTSEEGGVEQADEAGGSKGTD
jgi:hypothetical protein